MDTASHLLLGASLAGAACVHPQVAERPSLFFAVLTATLISSHAPDFDAITRFRSYTAYLRHHRGITHAVPAWFVWPIAIALPVSMLFAVWGDWPIVMLYSWLAVMIHVGLDWLNAYGVQAAKPFSSKWHHADVLCLFDPFLFAIHLVGIISWFWMTRADAAWLFLLGYLVSVLYIIWRWRVHQRLQSRLKEQFSSGIHHQLIPEVTWLSWQYVVEYEQHYETGWIRHRSPLRVLSDVSFDKHCLYTKNFIDDHVLEHARTTDGVRAFLGFAEHVIVSSQRWRNGYKIIWHDVRFWHRKGLPFGVEVELDEQLRVVNTKVGWSKREWEPPYV
ncbi:metal-dependent hydrolase [Paenibacillus sp. B1-33]|uniref:metal-dependent hydrolase n=1 Tax=unclassified Paenibacillus TaxID=185978 RepID=UPI003D26A831